MDEETKSRIRHLKIGSWLGIALFFVGFAFGVLQGNVPPELLVMALGFFALYLCLEGSMLIDLKYRIGRLEDYLAEDDGNGKEDVIRE